MNAMHNKNHYFPSEPNTGMSSPHLYHLFRPLLIVYLISLNRTQDVPNQWIPNHSFSIHYMFIVVILRNVELHHELLSSLEFCTKFANVFQGCIIHKKIHIYILTLIGFSLVLFVVVCFAVCITGYWSYPYLYCAVTINS